MAAKPGWVSMVKTCRATVLIVVLGGAALTLPPQTADMFAALGDRVLSARRATSIATRATSFIYTCPPTPQGGAAELGCFR